MGCQEAGVEAGRAVRRLLPSIAQGRADDGSDRGGDGAGQMGRDIEYVLEEKFTGRMEGKRVIKDNC